MIRIASSKKIIKRRNEIKKYLERNPQKNQEQIIEFLKKKGFSVTQATVSRDLDELDFRKTENGYVRSDMGMSWEEQVQEMFEFDPPRIHSKPLHTVSIVVNKGTAGRIAKLIEDNYRGYITGTIAGENLVIVFTTNPNQAKIIRDKLIRIRPNTTGEIDESNQTHQEGELDLENQPE